jgi:hypothetical protein
MWGGEWVQRSKTGNLIFFAKFAYLIDFRSIVNNIKLYQRYYIFYFFEIQAGMKKLNIDEKEIKQKNLIKMNFKTSLIQAIINEHL